jgi:hypothetical protein
LSALGFESTVEIAGAELKDIGWICPQDLSIEGIDLFEICSG